MLNYQIIYDLQFLQLRVNKQSRQHCFVYLRAFTNYMEVLKHLLCSKYILKVKKYVCIKNNLKSVSKENFMEHFIYIHHQNLLFLQIRFP